MKTTNLIVIIFYFAYIGLTNAITPIAILSNLMSTFQSQMNPKPILTTSNITNITIPTSPTLAITTITAATSGIATTTTNKKKKPPKEYKPRHGFGEGKQDWDWVKVREGAHLFWWLYYTTAKKVSQPTDRPLAIWLQGGPGASSSGIGNFLEIGPLDVKEKKRNHTWVRNMNVLFIDSPVGSGFSYVDDIEYLALNNEQIVDDLLILLSNFLDRLPAFRSVPIHIFGEGYGGKVAIELAYRLNKQIESNIFSCNLKSVTSINGWISPIDSILSWAPYLFNLGFVDHDGYHKVMENARLTKFEFSSERYENATFLWGVTEDIVMNITHGISFYNIMLPQNDIHLPKKEKKIKSKEIEFTDLEEVQIIMYNTLVERHQQPIELLRQGREDKEKHKKTDMKKLTKLMRGKVSEKLKVPDNIVWGSQSKQTFTGLWKDFLKPKTDCVESLLHETDINVVMLTGQLDLIAASPATVTWINQLHWSGRKEFTSSYRHAIIGKDTIVEGYYKTYGCFSLYWINRAGHSVPADNYKAMDFILRRVTKYHVDIG